MPIVQAGDWSELERSFSGHLCTPSLQLTVIVAKLVSCAPLLGN